MAKNNTTYELQLRQHPDSLVKKIVAEVVGKKAVDVQFEDDEDKQWAAVKIYEEDDEIAIRLEDKDSWVLYVGYYDDEDEFIEALQPLAQPEIDLIPKGLQKVMLKVLASEEGLRVPGNALSK